MIAAYVNTYAATYCNMYSTQQSMKQLLRKSLPAVLDGPGSVLGCVLCDGPGEGVTVLAVSGSERGIQGNETH